MSSRVPLFRKRPGTERDPFTSQCQAAGGSLGLENSKAYIPIMYLHQHQKTCMNGYWYSGPSLRASFLSRTRPWEDAVNERNERKSLWYADMTSEAEKRGQGALVCPIDYGSRGSIATTSIKLLKEPEIH